MGGPAINRVLGDIDALPAMAERDSIQREVERLRDENARLTGELAGAARANELFAGILGHDLRNPLGVILMSATVLSRKAGDENLKRALGRILTAGNRMNQMLAQLLDFTRVRAGDGLRIERARTDVATIFRRAVDSLADNAGGRLVTFEHGGDTRGWWDADRLAQVASSLVGNAFQHGTSAGAIRVQIRGEDPARVTIDVSNDGLIPADLLPTLFEPLQGGELQNRRGGLGLGLFVTREIITAHRGTVAVESAGDATTFTVDLPRGG